MGNPTSLYMIIDLQSAYGAVALISIGLGVHQLSISGGFMYSHVDVAGPKFSSIAFGVTNTAAQIPGFANPAIVAAVTKNVSSMHKMQKRGNGIHNPPKTLWTPYMDNPKRKLNWRRAG